jgi:hypothetical protein
VCVRVCACVRQVLEAGVPVLVYAGMEDFICNHMGTSSNPFLIRSCPASGVQQGIIVGPD